MDTATAELILRRAVLAYRPIEAVCEGLAIGESLEDASRKALVVLGLSSADRPRLDIALRWAEELGILSNGTLTQAINPTAAPCGPAFTAADVDSEAKARLYAATQLGRTTFEALDEHERRLLAQAVLEHSSDPRESVEKAGQALENYLRHLATIRGLDAEAKKCNGAGQLASLLVGKSVIHSNHHKLADSVGTFRNAKAHHKDKKTLTPWTITATGAVASVITALTVIRSIQEYVTTGGQTL